MKPKNPYKEGTVIWSVFEGDWEDLTITQIAEVLDSSYKVVSRAIQRIWDETGYDVPRVRYRRESKEEF